MAFLAGMACQRCTRNNTYMFPSLAKGAIHVMLLLTTIANASGSARRMSSSSDSTSGLVTAGLSTAAENSRYDSSPASQGHDYIPATSGYHQAMLPSWDEYVQQAPECTGEHLVETQLRKRLHVDWYKTQSGDFHAEPRGCKFKRLSADSARRCLANKTIGFMGDSLTRYQYLDFMYFMTKGKYMPRYGAVSEGERCLVHEHEWSSWPQYYEDITQKLITGRDMTVAGGCHCNRSVFLEDWNFTMQHKFGRTIANQYLVTSVNVTKIKELLYEQVVVHRTDFVILNIGFWIQASHVATGAVSTIEQVLMYGAELKQKHNLTTVLIWKTQTRWKGHPTAYFHQYPYYSRKSYDDHWYLAHYDKFFTELARLWGWYIHDAYAITDQALTQGLLFFWDTLHYWPAMYQELTDLLLNMVCG